MPELKRFVPFTRETLEAADETFDCVVRFPVPVCSYRGPC